MSSRQANGRLREVSCRVALRALEQRGVIKLPASRAAGDHCRGRKVKRDQIVLEEPAVALPTELRKLGRIELVVVGKQCPQEYQQWKQALERFHPEGHVALPQAR